VAVRSPLRNVGMVTPNLTSMAADDIVGADIVFSYCLIGQVPEWLVVVFVHDTCGDF